MAFDPGVAVFHGGPGERQRPAWQADEFVEQAVIGGAVGSRLQRDAPFLQGGALTVKVERVFGQPTGKQPLRKTEHEDMVMRQPAGVGRGGDQHAAHPPRRGPGIRGVNGRE